jgi:hypothetical protein
MLYKHGTNTSGLGIEMSGAIYGLLLYERSLQFPQVEGVMVSLMNERFAQGPMTVL